MTLTDTDLGLIRDEIGDTPDTATLQGYYAELGAPSWIPTALRVLRRRRASLAGQEVKNVSLPGGLAVGLSSNLSSLDRQIDRLQRTFDQLPSDDPCTQARSSTVRRASYRG